MLSRRRCAQARGSSTFYAAEKPTSSNGGPLSDGIGVPYCIGSPPMSAYRDPAGTAGAPLSLRRPIVLCARGDMPPNVALVHIAMAARDAPDVESILRGAEARLATKDPDAAHRIRRALELWRRNPDAFATISGILEIVGQTVDQAGIDSVEQWAAIFNRAASISPEASVALYSLGNPDLLRAT